MPPTTLDLAKQHHTAGRFTEAEALYQQILSQHPQNPDALHLYGVLAFQSNRRPEAIERITRAIQIDPNRAEFHSNLGLVLSDTQPQQAIESFRKALKLYPDFAQAGYNLGSILEQTGQTAEAIPILRRVLKTKPDFPDALNTLGLALLKEGQPDDAIPLLQKAIALQPKNHEAIQNLGIALREKGLLTESIATFQKAIALRPDYAAAWYGMAVAEHAAQRMDQALFAFRRIIDLIPGGRDGLTHLATVLKDTANLPEALKCLDRILELHPDDAEIRTARCFMLAFMPEFDPQSIRQAHADWNHRHAEPLAAEIRPHTNDRDPHRKLRIGYVSPDFKEHCQSCYTIPLLSHHDHAQFEIFCYARVAKPDALTKRIRGYADHWRDTVKQSDEQVAQSARDDKIDILIDLTMHMPGGRPLLFARKPAPVQVAWLAYPGTTGLTTIDYRLTDPYLDPPGQGDQYYSEQSFRLPETFWCYDPLISQPTPNPLPALINGHITFGCLNNFMKINDGTLALWSAVLKQVPNSRLLLLSHAGSQRKWVLDKLGVDPRRVEFVLKQERPDYFATYGRIDLCLDTLPYNGHTTSLDAFWMGVPVVTLPGRTVVGRGGLSLLNNLGMPELAAKNPEDFARIAAELAADLPRLAQLRATLRPRMEKSILMDGARFARNMESAFRQMWTRWCQTH